MFTTWSLTGGGRLREVVARKALTTVLRIVASQINGLTFSHLILLVVEAVKYDVFWRARHLRPGQMIWEEKKF